MMIVSSGSITSQALNSFASAFSGLHGSAAIGTELDQLEDAPRVEEIARMLGGHGVTAKTRANAEELLAQSTEASDFDTVTSCGMALPNARKPSR